MVARAFRSVEGRVRPGYARIGLLAIRLIALTISAAVVVLRLPDEAAFILPMWLAPVAIRSVDPGHDHHRHLHELIEQLETILTLATLLMLGAATSAGPLLRLRWPGVAVGVALVSVIRPLQRPSPRGGALISGTAQVECRKA